MSDDAVLRKMNACADRTHAEIAATQITHIPLSEYTEERVATLLAKVAEARRFWSVNEYRVNV